MTELDRIYEEIERLLEASFPAKYSDITQEELNNALQPYGAKGYSPAYIGDSDQLVLKNKYGEYGTINTDKQFVPYTKGQTKPSKKADYSPELLKSSNQSQPEQPAAVEPTPAPATTPAAEQPAKVEGEELTDGQQNGIVPVGSKGVEPSQKSQGKDEPYVADYKVVDEPTTEEDATTGEPGAEEQSGQDSNESSALKSLEKIAPDFWDSGYWVSSRAFTKNGDYYYETNNPEKRFRFTADESNPEQIKPVEAQGLDAENKNWWKLATYKGNGQWELLDGMEKVEDADTWLQNLAIDLESKVKDLQAKLDAANEQLAKIPKEAEAVLNTNTQLNYRLKSVIDSPDIQKQIDASPNGINYVGLNGDKISLITMGESLNSPIEIPSFLLKKLTEAKEVEISSLGAGGQTNLNVFLTPEIQEYLKSQKGNPNITKVMLGKDGLVWLMDDKNNPYLLNDMKVNDNVPAKDQKDNSVNVFINNGGAGNNGNGGNSQNANTNGDGNRNGGDGPSGEATGIVSRAEILAIKNTMAERVKNAVSSIKLDEVNNALKEYNTQINFTQLQLSKPLDGTYINDNSDWQSFTIKEANENETQEQKAEKKEETTPQQTPNGDPENYIIGKFTLTPIEEENKTQQGEGQEETPAAETPENNGEEPAQDTQSNKRNNWEDVLREAQELLKRVREEENPEAEEDAEEAAESDKEKEKAAAEAKKKEEEKNQVLQKCFMLSLVKASEAVAEALGTIKLQRKTNDQTTFTGRKTEETVFSFTPGQQKNFGWKKLDDNTFKCWFSVMIIKNGTTDTAGTKFNRVMNKVAGVANAVNKLNAGVSYDKV